MEKIEDLIEDLESASMMGKLPVAVNLIKCIVRYVRTLEDRVSELEKVVEMAGAKKVVKLAGVRNV